MAVRLTAEQERQAEENRRALLKAEAAALLLLLVRRRKATQLTPGWGIKRIGDRLERSMRLGIQELRYFSRLRGIERLLAEVDLPASAIPLGDINRLELARDVSRARAYAESYARRWREHASAGSVAKSVRQANTETLGSLQRTAVTESSEAFNTGRVATAKRVPRTGLLRVWDANLDKRSCPICTKAEGYIVGLKEPFPWGEPGTIHPNCFVPETRIEGIVQAASKAWYSGDVIHVRTASGRTLSVTSNHPVLTSAGFRPARELRKDEDLLCYTDQSRIGAVLLESDVDRRPASVAQVFDALCAEAPLAQVPGSGFYLHGDAKFVEGDIHVVRSNRALMGDLGAALGQQTQDLDLVLPDVPKTFGIGGSALELLFDTSDATTASGVRFCESCQPTFTIEQPPLGGLRLGLGAQLHTASLQTQLDHASRNTELFGELQRGFSGLVAPDKIVEIRNQTFSGHVFDVETATGWVLADGVVASNCRCSFTILSSVDTVEELFITPSPLQLA